MTHQDFHIGLDFSCGGKRWRCTDVGARVVVAISLEAREIARVEIDPKDPSSRLEERYLSDDPAWLNGPPYAVVEHVFDEDSLEACTLTQDA